MKSTARQLSAALALTLLSTGLTTQTQAAGYALIEKSASGMGNAFAGAAAIAEDASTVWFNPAGMMKLSGNQMILAGHFVSVTSDFKNNGSTLATGPAITGPDDDGGQSAFVPNFYYVSDLGNGTMFGIGITVPFGLSTDYNSDWVGRYTATKSEIQTMNINPSFASTITDKLAIGFGLNIQYIDATIANQLDSAAICQVKLSGAGGLCNANNLTLANIGVSTYDSSQSLSGDDLNIGWNAGLLYDLDKDSRLGIAYRSSIKHKLDGDVDFSMSTELSNVVTNLGSPVNTLFSDTGVIATVELPESFSISYYRNMNSKLAIMADVTWTRWSNFKELTIVFDNPVQGSSSIPENWDDSYRYSLGMKYQQDDKLTYRVGIAIDRTPIPSPQDRTPRIPGNDRTWLSLGIGYKMASDMTIDLGFSHLLVDDTDIDNTDASFSHTVTGTYDAEINILSAQANLKF